MVWLSCHEYLKRWTLLRLTQSLPESVRGQRGIAWQIRLFKNGLTLLYRRLGEGGGLDARLLEVSLVRFL